MVYAQRQKTNRSKMKKPYTITALSNDPSFPWRETKIKEFMKSGKLKAINIGESKHAFWIIMPEEVERFLKENTT